MSPGKLFITSLSDFTGLRLWKTDTSKFRGMCANRYTYLWTRFTTFIDLLVVHLLHCPFLLNTGGLHSPASLAIDCSPVTELSFANRTERNTRHKGRNRHKMHRKAEQQYNCVEETTRLPYFSAPIIWPVISTALRIWKLDTEFVN